MSDSIKAAGEIISMKVKESIRRKTKKEKIRAKNNNKKENKEKREND